MRRRWINKAGAGAGAGAGAKGKVLGPRGLISYWIVEIVEIS